MVALGRWPAALLGAAVAISINGLFSIVLFGNWYLGPYWTYTDKTSLILVTTLLPLSAHLIGGLVAGGVSRSSLGVSGALSATLAALVAVCRIVLGIVSVTLFRGPDSVPLSEELALVPVLAVLFAVYFPFTVLAGYLGGRLGGRFRAATP